MKNLSTIKYLNQILDTLLTPIRLHAVGSTTFIMFEPEPYILQVVKNILLDSEVDCDHVVHVSFNINSRELYVEYVDSTATKKFEVTDFPLGHNETTMSAAFASAMEMSKRK